MNITFVPLSAFELAIVSIDGFLPCPGRSYASAFHLSHVVESLLFEYAN